MIYLIARPNNKTLRVDKDTVTISSAVKGEFNDYIRISGRVQPMTTIQLSPQEGGIVEKILIEEGSPVKAGDAILILNNDNLDLQILNSEAELAEKENILRNTQIQMEQQKLDVRQNVLMSARSLGEINVQVILEALGGGGNSTTAGGRVENASILDVRQKLTDAIDDYFEK